MSLAGLGFVTLPLAFLSSMLGLGGTMLYIPVFS